VRKTERQFREYKETEIFAETTKGKVLDELSRLRPANRLGEGAPG